MQKSVQTVQEISDYSTFNLLQKVQSHVYI